ncbi:aldolase/citrate lyase family protein [Vitreoscilla filiformis]|nr:aldolase/citrate lyase family protein [Vitreoscilla filiformis]
MNHYERRMLEILRRGKSAFGFDAVKAEFEAEGTRHDEFLRLLHLARLAGLKVALKIGGCEAVRDLIESKQYGVDYIIAPMVETPYALKKFIEAKNKIYSSEEQECTDFLFNLETITGYQNLNALIATASAPEGVDGVVFGRVDFAGSLGYGRDVIQSTEVTQAVTATAQACKQVGLNLVVGGAVSVEAVPALTEIEQVGLTRFETRKIVFDAFLLPQGHAAEAIELAGEFELLWLENKQAYYQGLASEDDKRIKMLKSRFE